MIGLYHGTIVPTINAKEGIYFIKEGDNAYSIYAKVEGYAPTKYANLNEVTSATIQNLWENIGKDFVQKSFTVAGLNMQDNITVVELQNALELKALAYKNSATGTLEDFVTEVIGASYTPTGSVEINLGYDTTTITAKGTYYPEGEVIGTVVAEGDITFEKSDSGFAVSGTVSAPTITPQISKQSINQIASVGTLPSYTAAQYTAPSLTSQKASFATEGMVANMDTEDPSLLKFTWANTAEAVSNTDFNQGSYTAAQFSPGTLPTINDALSVVTDIPSITASAPTFTGDKIKANFVGKEVDIDAIFEGTEKEISIQGAYDKAKVTSVEFKGETKVITPTLQKEDKTITVS